MEFQDEKPPVPRDVLIRNHLQRWVDVKKKWIQTAIKNEDRYQLSTQMLQAIYNKYVYFSFKHIQITKFSEHNPTI